MNNSGSNNIVVPEAKQALNQMKTEIANELGLSNYEAMDIMRGEEVESLAIINKFPA